jgi:predicted Zn finger-like uncharacterized protein
MLSISCPECSQKLKVPAGAVGRKVKCTNCGHNFTALDASEFVPDSPEAAAAPVQQLAEEKVSIWNRDIYTGKPVPKPTPARTHGPIVCPYCAVPISGDVVYLGQSITCPHCHGVLKAPSRPTGCAAPSVLALIILLMLMRPFFM